MDPELKKSIDELTEAVRSAGSWEGRTNREVRNKIEEGAKEINELKTELNEVKIEFANRVSLLTTAIEDASSSSTKLGKIMIALTIILALSAIATAVAPLLGNP